jgi:hypothetical protein
MNKEHVEKMLAMIKADMSIKYEIDFSLVEVVTNGIEIQEVNGPPYIDYKLLDEIEILLLESLIDYDIKQILKVK